MSARIAICLILLWRLSGTAHAQAWLTERVRAAEPSIVKIEVDVLTSDGSVLARQSGTGFFVSRQGHLVTAAHLLASPDGRKFNGTIRVFTVRGSTSAFAAEVLAVETRRDVAVLRLIDAPPVVPLRFGRSVEAQEGDELAFAGYPAGTWTYNAARLTNVGVEKGLWGIEMATSGGSSGAPLIDRCGRVLALIRGAPTQTAHHQSVVVPQAEFFDLVRNYADVDDKPCPASALPSTPHSTSGPTTGESAPAQTTACVRAGSNFCLQQPTCRNRAGVASCTMLIVMDAGKPNWRTEQNIQVYSDFLTITAGDIEIEFEDGNRATPTRFGNARTLSQRFAGGQSHLLAFTATNRGLAARATISVKGTLNQPGGANRQEPFAGTFQNVIVAVDTPGRQSISVSRAYQPNQASTPASTCVRAGRNFCLTTNTCQSQGPWLTCRIRVTMDAGTPDFVEKRRTISGYTDGLTIEHSRAIVEFPDGTRKAAADLNNAATISQTFRGSDVLDIVIRVPQSGTPVPSVRIFVDGVVGPLRRGAQQVPFSSVLSDVVVLSATP